MHGGGEGGVGDRVDRWININLIEKLLLVKLYRSHSPFVSVVVPAMHCDFISRVSRDCVRMLMCCTCTCCNWHF